MFPQRKFFLIKISYVFLTFFIDFYLFFLFFITSSEKHRYYQGPVLILKYNVQLVAANFFYTEFKSCVEDGLFKLDDPSPQYVAKTVERANLPPDPYVLFARGAKHFSLNADTVQFQALFSREKGHKMHLEKDGSF